MIIRQTIHTADPEAWKEFIHACRAAPITESDTWSVYGLGRGQLGVFLAQYDPAGSVSVSLDIDRLDRFSSPYVRVSRPGEQPDLSVVGYDLPELLVHNLGYEPDRGGELSASPLLFTSQVKDNIPVLESLGLELRSISADETYAEFDGDGILALHVLDENDHEAPRIKLSFQHPDLDDLAEHLREAGFTPNIGLEDFGRSMRVKIGNELARIHESPTT